MHKVFIVALSRNPWVGVLYHANLVPRLYVFTELQIIEVPLSRTCENNKRIFDQ